MLLIVNHPTQVQILFRQQNLLLQYFIWNPLINFKKRQDCLSNGARKLIMRSISSAKNIGVSSHFFKKAKIDTTTDILKHYKTTKTLKMLIQTFMKK